MRANRGIEKKTYMYDDFCFLQLFEILEHNKLQYD